MFRGQLNHTGEAHTIPISSATSLWTYTTGNYVESSPAVAGGCMYVGGCDYKIYCLNATTGGLLWNYTTGDHVTSSPAVADRCIYVGSYDHKVYCLNATTGGLLWSYTTGNDVHSSPAVAGGCVYVGSLDRKIYCLNATMGGLLWNYTTGNSVSSSPAVAGGRVYVGSADKKIYCLNATMGGLLWNYTTGSYVTSSPAVAGGCVYIGSDDHKVYCLNATTGGLLWSYITGDLVRSSPAIVDERLYMGSCDYKVYCLNATTGGLLWNYTTGSYVMSSPAVAGDRIYIGSRDKNIYCLSTTTGGLLWRYTTGAAVWESSAVAGGCIYVGSADSKVYCLPCILYQSVPTAPQTLQATAGNGRVVLKWQAPSNDGYSPIINYKVYRSTSSGNESYLVTVGPILNYTDTGLINGQTYYYKVSAMNGVGEGPLSNEVNIKFVTVPYTTWGGVNHDCGFDVALDSSGNIYCVGETQSFGAGLADLALVKFYPNMTQAWNTTWGGAGDDYGSDMVLDPSGNIYCVGTSSDHLALVKFYSNGTRAWNTEWAWNTSYGSGVALDLSGNIYCVGTGVVTGRPRIVLVKFYPTGTLAWSTIANVGSYDYGSDVALDSSGNIYCVGSSWRMSWCTFYVILIKFYPTGNQTWYRTWGPYGAWHGAGMALDSSGNIYCVVDSTDLLYTIPGPMALVKFSPNGNPVWYTIWDGPGYEHGSGVALDSSGNIYCVGETSIFGTGSGKLGLIKFYSNGIQAWNSSWGGAGRDGGSDVALDSSGNIYCVGGTSSFGQGSTDLVLVKFATPSAPQNLQATAGNGQVILTWQVPFSDGGSDITNYKIYRGTSAGAETYLTTVGNILTYTNINLMDGQTYYYKVSAVNRVGEGPLSNEVSGISILKPIALISVLPNPSRGLTIITATNTSANINANGIQANVSTPTGDWLYPIMTYSGGNTWTGTFLVTADGIFTVRLNATDQTGNITYGGPMSITGDSTPPSLAIITSPTAGAFVKGAIWVNATAADAPSGIKNISFYRDAGVLIGTAYTAPYKIQWATNGLDGLHTLYVRAYDRAGNYLIGANVPITVDNMPPSSSILTSPAVGAYVKGMIWVNATAADAIGIKNVTFYRDAAVLIGTDTTIRYAVQWNTAGLDGAHSLYVRAFDYANNYLDSNTVAVTVDNTAPSSATIINPAAGTYVKGTIWINATAADAIGVKNVTFYRDTAQLLGADTIAPYSTTWNTTWLDGPHSLYVWAFDNAGNYLTSTIISVMVNNTLPVPTVPSAPQNLQASTGNQQITLTWQVPSSDGGSAITNYRIYRSKFPGNESLLTTIGPVLTYTDTNLTNGLRYYYRISAINGMGEGNLSLEVRANPATKPTAPHHLLVRINSGKIVLAWVAPADNGGLSIIGYNIYRGTSPGNETYYLPNGNSSTFMDANVINGQVYYYRISAVNALGESPWSAEVVAMVFASERGDQSFYLIFILLFGAVAIGISGCILHFNRKLARLKSKLTELPHTLTGKTASQSLKPRLKESVEGEYRGKQFPLSTNWNKVLSTLEKEFASALSNGLSLDEPPILEGS